MLAHSLWTKELLTSIEGSVTVINSNLLGSSLLSDEWNDQEEATKWVWNVELAEWSTRNTWVKVHKVILSPFLTLLRLFGLRVPSEKSMFLPADQPMVVF